MLDIDDIVQKLAERSRQPARIERKNSTRSVEADPVLLAYLFKVTPKDNLDFIPFDQNHALAVRTNLFRDPV
ncbi:MAG: hypothetical protein ACE5H0_14860, partial [Bacteroidota bacterium]